MQPRAPSLLVSSLALTLAFGCPSDFFQDSYDPTPAELAENVESAKLELVASAPQGDWTLRVEVEGGWDVESTRPSDSIEERELGCSTQECTRREYALHCPRGTCTFTLEIAALRTARGPLLASAGFVFDNDPGSDGCGSANPNYVPAEDRARLFALTWAVSDVVELPSALDAAVLDPVAQDASANDAGPDADAGELARDASDQEAAAQLDPVRISRGDPAQAEWWDLSVRGAELDAYEGVMAIVRIGDPTAPPERLGSGQARIADGAFTLVFPAVWEASLYKYKRAYLDVDGNGRCDAASDLVFSDARAARIGMLTIRPRPVSSPEDFPRSASREEDCAALDAWPVD